MTVVERARRRFALRRNLDCYLALIESSDLFDRAFYSHATECSYRSDRDAIRDYLLKGDEHGANANRLFNRSWYRHRYRDVAGEGIDALVHYILHGASELRDPHPLFLAEYYAGTVRGSTGNPLRHFLQVDAEATRSPHPLFLGDYYLERNQDVAASGCPAFDHFLTHGGYEVRAFHPLFDVEYYQRLGPRDRRRNILTEYVSGPRDRRTHYFFDPAFYLRTNADVAQGSISPLVHYVLRGSREGRAPHAVFDQSYYIARYPQARLARDGALGYFARVGEARGDRPNQYLDVDWYRRQTAGARRGLSPVAHFVTVGLRENLPPSPAFDPAHYLRTNPDIADTGQAAFAHYMEHGRSERRPPIDPASLGRFAVAVHLLHLDLLPDLEDYLRPLEGLLDILVSVPRSEHALFAAVVKGALPSARVVPVADCASDVGALFELAAKLDLSVYTAVCKLHTGTDGAGHDVMRHMILRCLVGSRQVVDMIADGFRFDADLWFVGPADFHIAARRSLGPNAKGVLRLFGEMYPDAWPDLDWGFFAGTMFWFRPAALDRLKTALARIGGLADGQLVDGGALSRAVERVFLLPGTIEGKLVGRVGFAADGPPPDLVISPGSEGLSNEEPADTSARFASLLDGKIRRSIAPPRVVETVPPAPRRLGSHVNLIGPLGFLNGLGTSVRAYLALLRDAGVTVNAIGWEQGFGRLSRAGIELPTTETPAPTNIVHLNLDLLLQGAFLDEGPLAAMMRGARRNILVFYWELPSLKPEWIPLIRRFDEVWCPTTFIRRMVRAACHVPTRLLRPDFETATHVASVKAERAPFGLPDDRFVFAYFADGGSIMQRKNPEAMARAFVEEFGEDEGTCCYLKIHYPEAAGATLGRLRDIVGTRRDVVLTSELYDDATMQALVRSIDCYVSPHRSEGLGLTIIEAMRNGKPVIATPFGGAADFVNETTAFPLAYELIEVGPGCAPYPEDHVWAEPSLDSIRRQMRVVFSERVEAARRADAASEAVRRTIAENREVARALFPKRVGVRNAA